MFPDAKYIEAELIRKLDLLEEVTEALGRA